MNRIAIVIIVPNKINVKNRITANRILTQKNVNLNARPKNASLIVSQINATLTLKNANLNAAQKNVEQKNAK
jgi:hypothetical protein